MMFLLIGDTHGISQLLAFLPTHTVAGIVCATIRPQYIDDLRALAKSLHVPFFVQPKYKSDIYYKFLDDISLVSPDLIWVNSYSMILRDDLLACARLGGINIHSALLPRNRGCNPIQWAILNGEFETGVTLHEIDSGLDTGPIIDSQKVPIFFEDTWLHVRERLKQATDILIEKNIPNIYSENWISVRQSNSKATTGRRRTPEDGEFSWSQPLVDIYNKVRALLPPLPPAFYQDKGGHKYFFTEYQSIWQLSLLRYQLKVGIRMQAENVLLRPLHASDADLHYKFSKQRNLFTNYNSIICDAETNCKDCIDKMITDRSDLVVFVIEDHASRNSIGMCQLFDINWDQRSAELQIKFDPQVPWRDEYVSEVINLLSRFGFKDLILCRIYSNILSSHPRIIREYEKCGYKLESSLNKIDCIDDSIANIFLMAKSEII